LDIFLTYITEFNLFFLSFYLFTYSKYSVYSYFQVSISIPWFTKIFLVTLWITKPILASFRKIFFVITIFDNFNNIVCNSSLSFAASSSIQILIKICFNSWAKSRKGWEINYGTIRSSKYMKKFNVIPLVLSTSCINGQLMGWLGNRRNVSCFQNRESNSVSLDNIGNTHWNWTTITWFRIWYWWACLRILVTIESSKINTLFATYCCSNCSNDLFEDI